MSSPTTARPVAPDERIVFWDLLRGVAVLGILLANIPFMSIAGALTDPSGSYVGGDSALDHACYYLVYVLADTKFITTFSLLFGVGLAWISERAAARGASFKKVYAMRLLVLLGIGIVHGTLIWFGDILAIYALIGFIAMWFHRCRVKTLLICAGILLLINSVLMSMFGLLDPLEMVELETVDGVELTAEQSLAQKTAEYARVFASGDFAAMVGPRSGMFVQVLAMSISIFGMRTLAMFLLGIAAVRSGIFVKVAEHRALYRRVAVIGIAVGLLLEAVSTGAHMSSEGPGAGRVLQMATLYFGGLALAFGYIGTVALWSLSELWPRLRARLAAVGRIPLTSYLTQSVLTAIVFNYCGLFDQWRRPELLLLVVVIFTLQLLLSPIWLRTFRYGPAEWLWRTLSYRHRP